MQAEPNENYMQKEDDKITSKDIAEYKKLGEYYDTVDIESLIDKSKEVHFDVDIKKSLTYYGVDENISANIQKLSKKNGVSSNELVNSLLQEKLQEIS